MEATLTTGTEMKARKAGDESTKLAETIDEVRVSAGTFIDTWPDRMSPELIRRKAEECRRRRPVPPAILFPVGKEHRLKKDVA